MKPDDRHDVLLSYSHDSEGHRARVLALADALRAAGVDAWIDRYAPWPVEGWPEWMEDRLRQARAVVAVCTPEYHRRFEEGLGTGVGYEADVIRTLRDTRADVRLVAVRFDDESPVPVAFRGKALRRTSSPRPHAR